MSITYYNYNNINLLYYHLTYRPLYTYIVYMVGITVGVNSDHKIEECN